MRKPPWKRRKKYWVRPNGPNNTNNGKKTSASRSRSRNVKLSIETAQFKTNCTKSLPNKSLTRSQTWLCKEINVKKWASSASLSQTMTHRTLKATLRPEDSRMLHISLCHRQSWPLRAIKYFRSYWKNRILRFNSQLNLCQRKLLIYSGSRL